MAITKHKLKSLNYLKTYAVLLGKRIENTNNQMAHQIQLAKPYCFFINYHVNKPDILEDVKHKRLQYILNLDVAMINIADKKHILLSN